MSLVILARGAVASAPRGYGKTNCGLLMAEQLASQGWVSVLIDPEAELEGLYGAAVRNEEELRERLTLRDKPIVVVSARNATEFVPYGRVILEVADEYRKPLFVMIDEGQLFSDPKKRKEELGEACDIINDIVGRGRKRAVDMFITALRFTGTLHRSIFSNANISFFGCLEDPTAWASLASQFRASRIEYNDLNALAPGEFFCFSRRGVEKVRMNMAEALKQVAPKAKSVKRTLPATFSQWNTAMMQIPTKRLHALSDSVVSLLGQVAGLPTQQMLSGISALQDELDAR